LHALEVIVLKFVKPIFMKNCFGHPVDPVFGWMVDAHNETLVVSDHVLKVANAHFINARELLKNDVFDSFGLIRFESTF